MYKRIIHFIKQEAVFTISLILAVISCFFVHPSIDYMEYIDFRVLALLFCLMAVIGGYSNIGFFHKLGKTLLNKAASMRSLAAVLVFLCFFSSMAITNDVALITFVPFTILILNMIHRNDKLILFIVLETIAANLGSMLTPLGNPQNLYLYTISGMNLGEFVLTLLPYTAISFLLLAVFLWRFPKERISLTLEEESDTSVISKSKLIVYTILFILCLLVVLHILPFQLVLGIVFVTVLLTDRKVLCGVDYILLLTFVCFFIFIGNMKNIPAVHTILSQIISGHEFASGVLASQCISNVPAAILLSGFTTEIAPLLIGVNVGGLGTLIASLASLISYKYYTKAMQTSESTHNTKTGSPLTQTALVSKPNTSGRYMLIFTAYNILFLIVLVVAYYLLTLLP